jgi:hypothetical protein
VKKITRFPGATSTLIIRANEDVQAIKNKFAREFWFASGREVVKVIARAKLVEVNFRMNSSPMLVREVLFLEFHLHLFLYLSQLNEDEIARTSLRLPKSLLPMKILAIRAKGIRAAAAATMTVTMAKLLGAMRVLRRLTSWARCLPELYTPSRLPLYICIFT